MLGNRSMGIRPREVAPRTTMASEAMRMAMPLRMARSVSHMGAMDPRGEAEHRSVGDWPWRRARSLGQPPTNPRRARSGPSAAASRGPCPGGSIGGSLDGPLRGLPPKSIARAKPALEAEHRSVGDWSLARDGDGSDLLPRLHEILALEDQSEGASMAPSEASPRNRLRGQSPRSKRNTGPSVIGHWPVTGTVRTFCRGFTRSLPWRINRRGPRWPPPRPPPEIDCAGK